MKTLQLCSSCFCIEKRIWLCKFDTCSIIREDKHNKKYHDECFIRIDHFCKDGNEKLATNWTNATETIAASQNFCLKEACNNKFVKEKCPSEGDSADSGDIFTEEEIESEDFRCQPKKSFRLGCNTCWCKADGKGPKYCTRIACQPKTYKPLSEL